MRESDKDAFHADRGLYCRHTVSSRNSSRTNKDNIASLERKYGKESNVVRVRVDGEFPEQEDDIFISSAKIEQCGSKLFELTEDAQLPNIMFGVDVARFGDDETAIYRNAKGNFNLSDIIWGRT